VVTSATGAIEKSSVYYPFGCEIPITGASVVNTYKFTGKERDVESGLDDFGARFDSSNLGRFLTPDLVLRSTHSRNPQSWNRYSYTYNNPLILVDPTGEEPVPSSLLVDVRMFRERTEKRIAAWGNHPQSAPNAAQPALEVSRAGSDPGEYGGAKGAGEVLKNEAEKQIASEITIGFEKWITDPATTAEDIDAALLALDGIEKQQSLTIPQPFSWALPGIVNRGLWVLQKLGSGAQDDLLDRMRRKLGDSRSKKEDPEAGTKRHLQKGCLKLRDGSCVNN